MMVSYLLTRSSAVVGSDAQTPDIAAGTMLSLVAAGVAAAGTLAALDLGNLHVFINMD